eukprot:TRINITY_DN2788_c0_g1_i1.p1 TRINITY_DN2788_c0_g1~~TRINITY_DN2788_c0_g1_i1.p1  ORF type:complete len:113 (+),score=21.59 TRINITY_DN2788_c0_g1_i1:54-392(+)
MSNSGGKQSLSPHKKSTSEKRKEMQQRRAHSTRNMRSDKKISSSRRSKLERRLSVGSRKKKKKRDKKRDENKLATLGAEPTENSVESSSSKGDFSWFLFFGWKCFGFFLMVD